MIAYTIRRLIYGVLILLGVNLATFFLFFTVNTPDDMARLNIGGKRVTQELIEKWKVERGYDKPLYWNEARTGSRQLTDTILWERSVSLMLLDFGRSDSARSTDIGHEVAGRMWVSLQLALPLFILQVIASTAFALLLVTVYLVDRFRHSALGAAAVDPDTHGKGRLAALLMRVDLGRCGVMPKHWPLPRRSTTTRFSSRTM